MKYMMNATVAVAALSVLTLGMGSDAAAAAAGSAACDLKIKLTEKAEMMEGGAKFTGTLGTAMAGMKMDKKSGVKMDKMAKREARSTPVMVLRMRHLGLKEITTSIKPTKSCMVPKQITGGAPLLTSMVRTALTDKMVKMEARSIPVWVLLLLLWG